MTRTQILYAWKELAPTDDESTIDAINSMVEMITGAKDGFVAVSRDELEDIRHNIGRAELYASDAISAARDAEDAAESARLSLRDLLEK